MKDEVNVDVRMCSIIFLKTQFSRQIMLEAIKKTETEYPKPHPYQEESYILSDVTDEIAAIFYEVNGYSKPESDFRAAVELFREDQFPSLIKTVAREHRSSFCFYVHICHSKDDFVVTCKYDERGFEERQSIDGSLTRIFGKDNDVVQVENYDRSEHARYSLVENYLMEELGIPEQMLIDTWNDRYNSGTVISAYRDGLRVK